LTVNADSPFLTIGGASIKFTSALTDANFAVTTYSASVNVIPGTTFLTTSLAESNSLDKILGFYNVTDSSPQNFVFLS